MSIGEREVAGPQLRTAPTGHLDLGRELLGLLALVVVAAAAAGFADLFRETSLGMIRLVWDTADPTGAARHPTRLAVLVTVAAAVALAVWIGRRAVRWRGDRVGITAVSAAAQGQGPGPSLRATLLRAGATWVASSGLASLGREGAIIETGGALGSVVGRRLARLGPALAAGGIGAAFAAAYHAPIAGALYVEEHLRVRRDPRSAAYAAIGAAVGHLVTVTALGGHAVLPGTQGSRPGLLILALIGLVPAVAGGRVFLRLRERATAALSLHDGSPRPRPVAPVRVAVLAGVAALLVVAVPLTSGNGAEALHHAALSPTLGIALALALAKLLATTAALGAGAPGGVFSPTLSVSAGWALVTYLVLESLGLALPGAHWDGMLIAMAIGVAVGLRSPLVAVFVIPEMTGDLSLIPLVALAVLAATVVDRHLDRWQTRSGHPLPAPLHDEDG